MRKVAIGVAVLLALGAAGAYLAFHYVDVVVKMALERYGPDVLGAPVQVADVAISPRDGRGAIRGLDIGNPAGFAPGRLARFREIRVAVEPATFTRKVVHVRELAIESPQVTYERGARGTNLEAVSRNIEAYLKKAGLGEPGGKAARGEKRRFVIDRLTIRGGQVVMTNPALKGQGLQLDLPAVELRDVGRREGGLTAGEVANVVAVAFESRIAQRVLTNIDALRRGGVEGAVDALRGLIK